MGKKDKVGDGEDEGESEDEGTQDTDTPDLDNCASLLHALLVGLTLRGWVLF